MKTLFTAAAVAAITAGAAFAQDAEISFEALDTDGNAVLSFEEVQAAVPDLTVEEFTKYDEDGDFALTEDEFDAWAEDHAESDDQGEDGDGEEPADDPYQR